MKETGTWIWPEKYSELKVIEVKPKDLNFIKSLIVGWDVTELGAPAFMTKDGNWLYDIFDEEPKKELLLNLFINQAKLKSTTKTYNNPLTNKSLNEDAKKEALCGFPNKEIKKLLESEKIIEIEVSETLQKLWDSCWLGARGFDPKRGFRLHNLQELIAPEKSLSKNEITKKRNHFKGLLFLYLQLFIKEAILEPGFYHSYDNINWLKGKNFGITKEYTSNEWWLCIDSDYFKKLSEFVELMSALPKLVKHLSAKKTIDYQFIVEIFNLDTLFKYDSDNIHRNDIQLDEILLKSLDYFPDEKKITANQERYPFILLLVRIYNTQGRFKEAKKLLQENNLDLYTEKQLEFYCKLPNKYQQIAFYESCICKMVETGNYDLWRFSDNPKFTDEEIKKFDIYTGTFFLDDLEQKMKYEEEQKKIKRLLKARGTLSYDIRSYLNYSYLNDLNSIYEDLDKNNLRQDLDEIMVSIIGQINLLMEINYGR
ncbi:hypothetical protein [uncultured Polaribacter sp.]|uniref:hypothetical protein n=1 Tax=uncultured Polaribacter sp. TaxID=174711 RepID=UPI0026242254|nr:hypothetical protein [uncultured Polaribacter sp.]